MIGKVKKWLGIEGVKLELLLPDKLKASTGLLEGRVRLQSLKPQRVRGIRIVLIERYSRGRGKEKLVDEYELGDIELNRSLEVLPGELHEIPFSLPFSITRSNVDEFAGKNMLFGGLAKAAKAISAVRSEYRVEAEAQVEGVALNPFDKKPLLIKP